MASPLRLNPTLVEAAEREGALQKRSAPKQIEFWAELGKAVDGLIDTADVIAVIQGLKEIKVVPMKSAAVNPRNVFDAVETLRKRGALREVVTSAAVYYEASLSRPGLLDRVDSRTGERRTGQFHNGVFKVQR
jgi:hypothetical protein